METEEAAAAVPLLQQPAAGAGTPAEESGPEEEFRARRKRLRDVLSGGALEWGCQPATDAPRRAYACRRAGVAAPLRVHACCGAGANGVPAACLHSPPSNLLAPLPLSLPAAVPIELERQFLARHNHADQQILKNIKVLQQPKGKALRRCCYRAGSGLQARGSPCPPDRPPLLPLPTPPPQKRLWWSRGTACATVPPCLPMH